MVNSIVSRRCANMMRQYYKTTLLICLSLSLFLLTFIGLHTTDNPSSQEEVKAKCFKILGYAQDSTNRKQVKVDAHVERESPQNHKNSPVDNVNADKNNLVHIRQATYDINKLKTEVVFKPILVNESEIAEVLKFARETPLGQRKINYKNQTTSAQHLDLEIKKKMAALKKFQLNIGQYDIYRENDPLLEEIIQEMRTAKIESSEQHEKGTQFKLIFTFENEERAMFKPMRFPREVGTWENHFYFSDFERHYSEIASFHLDRILGFRRAVPVTGRYISIAHDVNEKTSETVQKTIFKSPANSLCMVGDCKYYCETGHAICGHPDEVEGSFAAYLPSFDDFPITRFFSPYRRSYSKRKKAKWEDYPKYCEEKVLPKAKYNEGRLFLDMIDMYIFDFLTGNMDRHHMEYFSMVEPEPYLIHLDHGRGFGKTNHDDLSILTPLIQCCFIRLSTLKTLVSFYDGPSLSERMRKAMQNDPAAPVLLESHLQALDRRVKVILKHVQKCAKEKSGMEEVITDDGY